MLYFIVLQLYVVWAVGNRIRNRTIAIWQWNLTTYIITDIIIVWLLNALHEEIRKQTALHISIRICELFLFVKNIYNKIKFNKNMQMTGRREFVTTEHIIFQNLANHGLYTYSSESVKHNHWFTNVHFFLPCKNCY